MAGCHAGIHDDSRGGVSCGADVLRDEPEDIYVHAFYRAVSHAVVFLCEWILGMEGGHDLDAEPIGMLNSGPPSLPTRFLWVKTDSSPSVPHPQPSDRLTWDGSV